MIHLHLEFTGYAVSKDGYVWSLNYRKQKGNTRRLSGRPIKGGYLSVTLWENRVKYEKLVHRLVAEVFIPNPENKPEVNHKDGNKTNNFVENLEWVTASENVRHAHDNGLKSTSERVRATWRKINADMTPEQRRRLTMRKLTDDQIREIRAQYAEGGISQKALGKKFGIAGGHVSRIINRKLYAEIA